MARFSGTVRHRIAIVIVGCLAAALVGSLTGLTVYQASASPFGPSPWVGGISGLTNGNVHEPIDFVLPVQNSSGQSIVLRNLTFPRGVSPDLLRLHEVVAMGYQGALIDRSWPPAGVHGPFYKLDGYRLGPHKAVSIVVAFRARVPGVYYFGHGATVHADRTGPWRYMPFLGKTFSYTYSGAYETFCVGVPDDACSASTGSGSSTNDLTDNPPQSVRWFIYTKGAGNFRSKPITMPAGWQLGIEATSCRNPQPSGRYTWSLWTSRPNGTHRRRNNQGQPGDGSGFRILGCRPHGGPRIRNTVGSRCRLDPHAGALLLETGSILRFQDSAVRLTLADRGSISVFGLRALRRPRMRW